MIRCPVPQTLAPPLKSTAPYAFFEWKNALKCVSGRGFTQTPLGSLQLPMSVRKFMDIYNRCRPFK